MSDHDPRAENPSADEEEREIRRLLELAGPRPEIPGEDLQAITAAARTAWRETVDGESRSPARAPDRTPNRSRSRLQSWALPLAAALVVAVGIAWWLRPAAPAPEIARLERVAGTVRVDGEPVETVDPGVGVPLSAGAVVSTAGAAVETPGHASLRLDGIAAVRLDAGTRLRLAAAQVLELERGAIYVDTDPAEAEGGGALAVRTPLGTARDLGTRFALRLIEHSSGADRADRALRVRVRDGAVAVERGGTSHVAAAGYEVVLHGDGEVERREIVPYGPDWGWVLHAAPRFRVEGKTLQEFLDWVARETGWGFRYEDEALAASAERITLHGSLGDLRPDQAPFAVLPGAGLEGEVEAGVLTVRRTP